MVLHQGFGQVFEGAFIGQGAPVGKALLAGIDRQSGEGGFKGLTVLDDVAIGGDEIAGPLGPGGADLDARGDLHGLPQQGRRHDLADLAGLGLDHHLP